MNEIVNKYYKEIEPIIIEIRNYRCSTCLGTYHNCSCEYCENKNNDLEIILERLKLTLNKITIDINSISNIGINKLLNLLYRIEDKVDCIRDFLSKYNYQELFHKYADERINTLENNKKLSNLDINVLETIIYQKNKKYNLPFLYHHFIQASISGNKNVSLDCFNEIIIIINLAELTLSPFYRSPTCILKHYENGRIDEGHLLIQYGANKADKIFLNIDAVKELYFGKDINIITTIFHEACHGVQYNNIFNGNQNLDPLVLLEIKDNILAHNILGYYKENYHNISYEIEAEYFGMIMANKYTNCNIKDIFIQKRYTNILNKQRLINGKQENIDNIFNKYILTHKTTLDKHPQLKLLYKIEQDKVIPLTPEELEIKYHNLINSNISDEDKRKYTMVFSEYIDTSKLESKKLS